MTPRTGDGPELLGWQYVDGRYDHLVPRMTVAGASRLIHSWRRDEQAELGVAGRHLLFRPAGPLPGLRVTDLGALDRGAPRPGAGAPGAGEVGTAGGPTSLATLVATRRRRRGLAGRLRLSGYPPIDWIVPDAVATTCGFVMNHRNLVLFAHDGTAITGFDGGIEVGGVPLLALLLAVGWFLLLLEARSTGRELLTTAGQPRPPYTAYTPDLAAPEDPLSGGTAYGRGEPWASPPPAGHPENGQPRPRPSEPRQPG